MSSFASSFWDVDICSNDGFDIVSTQLHNGRELCKAVEDYLKQRSKMEEDYGKALLKLAHASSVHTGLDDSSLLSSWKCLKQETEKLAQSHLNLSRAFSEQQSRLATLMLEQKRNRKTAEDEVRKLQAAKKDSYRKTIEMKKIYHKRCNDADLQDKLTTGTVVLKEKEKMQNKQMKLRALADGSDKSYGECVDALTYIHSEWEQRMEEYLIMAEDMETSRILAVRNELWEHCNFVSIACVIDDECCEKVRKSLEGSSEVRDIRDFILQHRTGSTKPEFLVYENYYQQPRNGSTPS